LLRDLTEKGLFGKMLSYVHVIEFQKRGLPHAHILTGMVEDAFKPRSPEEVDKIVDYEVLILQ
jgi:hypothetical protein